MCQLPTRHNNRRSYLISDPHIMGRLGSKRTIETTTYHELRNTKIRAIGKQRDCEALLNLYEKEKHDFDLVNHVTTLSQLARMSKEREPLQEKVGIVIENVTDYLYGSTLDTRWFPSILYFIARLQIRNEATQRITTWLSNESLAKELLKCCDTQALGRLAWACAKLGAPAPTIFADIEKRCEYLVSNGHPQDIANMAWACATLGHASPGLFASIEKRSSWYVLNGTPYNIGTTAWACGKLGHPSPALFKAIEKRCDGLVSDCNTQMVKNAAKTAWACATLGHFVPDFFAAIEKQGHTFVSNGEFQDIASTAWACAKLGHSSPTLFTAIEDRCSRIVPTVDPQHIANMAWACGEFGYYPPTLFACVEEHSDRIVSNATTEEIGTILKACTLLGYQLPHFSRCVESRLNKMEPGTDHKSLTSALALATKTTGVPLATITAT